MGTTAEPLQIIKLSQVNVYPGRFLLNGKPGLLIWFKNNDIGLFIRGQAEPVFICQPTDITRFLYWPDHTTIKLRDGRKFMTTLNLEYQDLTAAGSWNALVSYSLGLTGGLVGQGVSLGYYLAGIGYDVELLKSDNANDSVWWVTTLSRFGVKATRMTLVRLAAWMLLTPIVVIVVLFVVVIVFGLLSKLLFA